MDDGAEEYCGFTLKRVMDDGAEGYSGFILNRGMDDGGEHASQSLPCLENLS